MSRRSSSTTQTTAPLFLGIECGGTRSVAVLAQSDGKQWLQSEAGPANIKLLSDSALVDHFRAISNSLEALPGLRGIAIGMAGARGEADRQRIRDAAGRIWPKVPCYATNDLETAITAAETSETQPVTRVLILSGTGSCCFGRTPEGKTLKLGGWGHLLGDKGSGYETALRAMKAVVFQYDRDGKWPALGQRILRSLQLNEPNELIEWVQQAGKSDIAAVAVQVFDAWKKQEKIATDIITAAAESLAQDGAACATRLVKAGTRVEFVLSGSNFSKQREFAKLVGKMLRASWRNSSTIVLQRESVWGAVELAKQHCNRANGRTAAGPVEALRPEAPPESADLSRLALSPTETRNPRSVRLDQLPLQEMIELMLREDARIPEAIRTEKKKIEQVIRMIVRAFKQGGRLFYVGAGTSGRLGVLDASECPPTFRTPPDLVQGIIAGGQVALWKAVEGAEDNYTAGAQAIVYGGITRKDVVVGIAASGRTPFVWGALHEGKRRGAATVLLCFNPHLRVAARNRPKVILAINVGPEVLTGSTRLKAGTATKLVLNMFTTLAMVRMGKVVSNLMVDLNPSNVKLRDRAVRIVQELTGVDAVVARDALNKYNWMVKAACDELRAAP